MSKGPRSLTYEMEEPAFLRRLRQQHSGTGGPERYIAPRNKKRPTDEDEDAPTYVLDEGSGETLSRKEFEAMNNGEVVGGMEGEEESGIKMPGEKEPAAERENITEIGGKGKRRKVARIIGDGDDDDAMQKDENNDKGSGKEETEKKKKGRAGGRAKKAVKLSFDHDE
ncbi:unnamed protein product [Tuber aestivum]|uniref:DUF4604 domain-containing protein n=1 Tax=Tuber aestivum TaxID=59557 RepID=A0A292PLJ3_9PEZI|nr:unnamed protein product [Tuber aestivum]